jgi:hypothetical protein
MSQPLDELRQVLKSRRNAGQHSAGSRNDRGTHADARPRNAFEAHTKATPPRQARHPLTGTFAPTGARRARAAVPSLAEAHHNLLGFNHERLATRSTVGTKATAFPTLFRHPLIRCTGFLVRADNQTRRLDQARQVGSQRRQRASFRRLPGLGNVGAAQTVLVAPPLASPRPSRRGRPRRGHQCAWRAEWLRLSRGHTRQE